METNNTQPKTAHTPGPWDINRDFTRIYISPDNRALGDIAVMTDESGKVDTGHSQRAIANGRLIAAAPELLAVVKMIVNDIPPMENNGSDLARWSIAARAAIAKAEGRA